MNADETLYEGAKPYVFISYSHEDKERVFPALDAMRKHGYRFWYDKRIHPGEPWTKSLAEHLSNCTVFMPFLSPAFLQSRNCLDEVRYVHGKKNIVPVWLDKLDRNTISDELKFLFSNAQELRAYQFADADAFAACLDTEHIRPCRDADADTVAASVELVTNERPVERTQAISFDGTEKLLNSLNGESALEHCRKPRQEDSLVSQKPDVPEKQNVPQKPDNVQSKTDTQRKENTKHTPPKDPKKVISSGRSEDIREKRKKNFDMCRIHLKVWSIIALITLALTIVAYYTDEPQVYLAMEDEIRLYFWGGILGCFIAGVVGYSIYYDYSTAYAGWEHVRNQLSTMEWYVTRDGVLTILNAEESEQGIIYSDYTPDGNFYVFDEGKLEWLCIQSIIIKPGISEIYGYSFQDYTCLINIEIPESVKKIHSHAFENCAKLKSVTIPSGTDYEKYAFPPWTSISRK